jgi:hypothetical protein
MQKKQPAGSALYCSSINHSEDLMRTAFITTLFVIAANVQAAEIAGLPTIQAMSDFSRSLYKFMSYFPFA